MSRSPHSSTRTLKVYIEDFTGFSHVCCPDGLNNTWLSEGCVLENSSACGNCGQNVYSKDRGGAEESLITWIQLSGQPAVMSSQ